MWVTKREILKYFNLFKFEYKIAVFLISHGPLRVAHGEEIMPHCASKYGLLIGNSLQDSSGRLLIVVFYKNNSSLVLAPK